MSKRSSELLIKDMILACERILEYTAGMSYVGFCSDTKTIDATVRNIEILGEAARNVSEEVKIKNSRVEWTKIIRSRNIIVHEYFGLDYVIIWRIVEAYIPELLVDLRKIDFNH